MEELEAILARIDSDDNPPTAEELTAARDELRDKLKAESALASPDLEVLRTLKAAYDQIDGAIAAAEAREQALRDEVNELLADVDLGEGGEGGEGEGDGTDEDETDDDSEDADDRDREPVLAGGKVKVLSLSDAAARMRGRPAPPPVAETPQVTGVRTYVHGREHQGAPLALEDVRKVFAETTKNPQRDGKSTLIRFETVAPDGWVLSGDIGKRTSQVDSVTAPEAVAAAGGCCILPEPIRDQPMLSSTARPIRDSLPSFGIQTTGAVTFYPPVCFPQDGAYIWTCDDDAAVDPEDPDTWKSCAEFDCDDPVTTTVDAIYRCITIGNFQRFFDGERWRAVLGALLASEAQLAESHLWTKMRGATNTTHILGDTGSVFVSFIQGIGIMSELMREDQRLADVNLHLWAPNWLRGAMRDDLVARRVVHIDNPVAADTLINTAIGNTGATVTWTGPGDVAPINADPPIVSGPMPDYPDIAPMILAPEGYFTYLDAGSFDLGTEIRDFNLTRQNAVAAFAEEFQGLMARGCNAMSLDLPVSVCRIADGCEPLS